MSRRSQASATLGMVGPPIPFSTSRSVELLEAANHAADGARRRPRQCHRPDRRRGERGHDGRSDGAAAGELRGLCGGAFEPVEGWRAGLDGERAARDPHPLPLQPDEPAVAGPRGIPRDAAGLAGRPVAGVGSGADRRRRTRQDPAGGRGGGLGAGAELDRRLRPARRPRRVPEQRLPHDVGGALPRRHRLCRGQGRRDRRLAAQPRGPCRRSAGATGPAPVAHRADRRRGRRLVARRLRPVRPRGRGRRGDARARCAADGRGPGRPRRAPRDLRGGLRAGDGPAGADTYRLARPGAVRGEPRRPRGPTPSGPTSPRR